MKSIERTFSYLIVSVIVLGLFANFYLNKRTSSEPRELNGDRPSAEETDCRFVWTNATNKCIELTKALYLPIGSLKKQFDVNFRSF
jgi:hypothetical protein